MLPTLRTSMLGIPRYNIRRITVRASIQKTRYDILIVSKHSTMKLDRNPLLEIYNPGQCLVSTVVIGALSGASQTFAEYPHALHLYFEIFFTALHTPDINIRSLPIFITSHSSIAVKAIFSFGLLFNISGF
jgi:hypothetical protein